MNDQVKVKIAPNSKESEMMVLGCMLTNESYLKIGTENLSECDFYYSEHKIIFGSLRAVYKETKLADVHLICEDLKRKEQLKSVGGAAYITTLAQYAGTSAYVEEYIDELKKLSKQRQLIQLSKKIEEQALEQSDPSKIIAGVQETLHQIERIGSTKDRFQIQFIEQFSQNFLLTEPPKKQMLLEYFDDKNERPIGFLPKSIVAMLVGAGGLGKTHLLAQLAISVSTGTPWLGMFSTTKHCGHENKGNVFFGVGENQYEDIHRVLYKASKILRHNQPDLTKQDPLIEASSRIAPFSFCGQQASFIENGRPSTYFRQLKNRLIDIAPKGGWSIIILDPVSRLMGADAETDNAAATQFISLLEELTIDLPGNPTVLFAHHVSKAAINETNQNQTAARGSSALTDGVRLQFNLSKNDKEELVLKMTKSNFTAISEQIYIKKDNNGYLENCSTSNRQLIKKNLFG